MQSKDRHTASWQERHLASSAKSALRKQLGFKVQQQERQQALGQIQAPGEALTRAFMSARALSECPISRMQ